jgi:hypothetical protein
MKEENKLNISELFLAYDGKDKYFYGEIIRNNNSIFGKIYINDHIIFSKVENNKINHRTNCFKNKSDNFLIKKLGDYLDDTVILILYHDILKLENKSFMSCNFEIVLN